jgi:serine/threonine protein kinase
MSQAENRKEFDKNLYIWSSLNSRLGSGTFGSVYKGVYVGKDGQELPSAIKVFNSRSMQENKELEGAILQGLEHPNIVRVYQTGVHDKEGYYIAMELCDTTLKGFLHKHGIRKFSEREAKTFFIEICQGVKYLQSKNIIHRDLKFENILIDFNNNLKLADFGLAKMIEETSLTMTTCGSTHIMAPEIFKRQPYGKASDIWSLGVILFGMLSGDECIFKNVNRAEYEERMKHFKTLTLPADLHDLSNEAKDLLLKILNPDPAKRLSVDQILEHPWLSLGEEDLYTSAYFINNYNQTSTNESSMASEIATQISKDITSALTKTINSIFSNLIKIHETLEIFKTVGTDMLNFEELYLYNCIKLVTVINKLENLEFVGTNQVSYKIQVLKLFEGVRKTLFMDLKLKLMEDIKRISDRLDMRSRIASEFEDSYLESIFSTVDAIVSKDMSKALVGKELRKLYQACLMSFTLYTKDYDQFVCDVKLLQDGLGSFAEKHKLDIDSFKTKAENFVNQVTLSFEKETGAKLLNSSDMKGLYEISFKITCFKRQYLDEFDKVFKDIENRIELRLKELK